MALFFVIREKAQIQRPLFFSLILWFIYLFMPLLVFIYQSSSTAAQAHFASQFKPSEALGN